MAAPPAADNGGERGGDMADLGVEVKLEPKLNRADFESAVKGMKLELPVEVNTRTLTSSINSAIDSVKAHKLKIGVDTTYLSSQISKVLQSQLGTQATSNSATKAATQQAAQLRAAQAQVSKMQRSVANMNIGGKLGTDKLQNLSGQFENAVNGFNDAKNSAEGFQTKLDDVTRSYQDLLAAQKRQATDNTNERRLQRESQHLANIQRQARELIENNPRVLNTSLYGQLNDIINRASGGQSNSVELSRDLANVRSEMERLGVTSENVGQRISRLFRDHFNTAIAMAGLHLLQNSLQEIVASVIDVDTAMTDLQKVSNATAAEYDSFLEGAESRAKSLGATITDVIGATSEFSRLGYNLDESSTLGDAAVKYLNVSEYTNIEDAAQSLVSTMQAFGIEADQVGSIVDKFNEIGNNFAISSQGLGEAMQRSAAALSLAGNTLDESLALVTAANEVVDFASWRSNTFTSR